MAINPSNDEKFPIDTDDYYETVASQEEIYREETEERLRASLTSDDPSSLQSNSLSIGSEVNETILSSFARRIVKPEH
jgi:hypothetical protein